MAKKLFRQTKMALKKYGEVLKSGDISDEDLAILIDPKTFTKAGGPTPANPPTAYHHSQIEAIDNFVLNICPQLTKEVLHKLTDRLITRGAFMSDSQSLMRKSTLEKAFFAYEFLRYPEEAERHFTENEAMHKEFGNTPIGQHGLLNTLLNPIITRYREALTKLEESKTDTSAPETKAEEQSGLEVKTEPAGVESQFHKKDAELIAELNGSYQTLVDALKARLGEDEHEYENTKRKIRGVFKLLGISKQEFKAGDKLEAEDVFELRRKLEALGRLYIDLRPSTASKLKAKLVASDSPREKLRELLKGGQQLDLLQLDPIINRYLVAASNVIGHRVGYYNARVEAEQIRQVQDKYKDCKVEILRLKRHEYSGKAHKKFSFGSDIGLNAVDKRFLNRLSKAQSIFDLDTAKTVQSNHLRYMKKMEVVDKVEVFISPVTRSWQTAEYATFEDDLVEKKHKHIDACLAEKQHALNVGSVSVPLTILKSGTASHKPSELAERLGIPPENIKGDYLIPGETKTEYKGRVEEAYQLLTTNFAQGEPSRVTERDAVTHGQINKDILRHFKERAKEDGFECIGFPEGTPEHLDYGARYNLIIVRNNDDNKIKAVIYNEISTRFGEHPHQPPPKLYKKLLGMEKVIETKRAEDGESLNAPYLQAGALFKYCMLQPNEKKVKNYLREHAVLLLDHLRQLNQPLKTKKDLDRAIFIVDYLMEQEMKMLTEKESRSVSRLGTFLSDIKTLKTGKTHKNQREFLEQVNAGDHSVPVLEAKLIAAKHQFSPGKVTHLIEALLKIEQARPLVVETAEVRQSFSSEHKEPPRVLSKSSSSESIFEPEEPPPSEELPPPNEEEGDSYTP